MTDKGVTCYRLGYRLYPLLLKGVVFLRACFTAACMPNKYSLFDSLRKTANTLSKLGYDINSLRITYRVTSDVTNCNVSSASFHFSDPRDALVTGDQQRVTWSDASEVVRQNNRRANTNNETAFICKVMTRPECSCYRLNMTRALNDVECIAWRVPSEISCINMQGWSCDVQRVKASDDNACVGVCSLSLESYNDHQMSEWFSH